MVSDHLIKRMKQEIEGLERDVSVANNQIAKLRVRNSDIETDLQRDLAELRRPLDALKQQYESERIKFQQTEEKYRSTEQTYEQSVKRATEEANRSKQNIDRQIVGREQDRNTAETKLRDLRRQVEMAERELATREADAKHAGRSSSSMGALRK